MNCANNQAVIFTKPVHHLGIDLSPRQLAELTETFFKAQGFNVVLSKMVTGSELAQRDVIKQHYLMYSKAACAASAAHLDISIEGKAKFEAAFGQSWETEVEAGRISGTAELLNSKGIDAHQLFDLWNVLFAGGKTVKIQDGVIMAYLEGLDAYCMNAFYPSMEANFYDDSTEIHYYVVEFAPERISWKDFRKKILGATNSSKADPASFRGQLYAKYKVEFPGRDNFVHGSAGPVEGFIERIIHEPDFDMGTSPIGRYLAGRGITIEAFKRWKSGLSITQLGDLFDRTEEKNTGEALAVLDTIRF